MNPSKQLAKHIREMHFGGNWTCVNLKDTLADVNWQQATTKIYSLNTIATLVYHLNYFISAVLPVLRGEPLNAHDKYSFDHPPIHSQEDWQKMLDRVWMEAEEFANMVEQIPESKLWEIFSAEKYGIYFRNLIGIIEHTHYHLGQIVIIKKVLSQQPQ